MIPGTATREQGTGNANIGNTRVRVGGDIVNVIDNASVVPEDIVVPSQLTAKDPSATFRSGAEAFIHPNPRLDAHAQKVEIDGLLQFAQDAEDTFVVEADGP